MLKKLLALYCLLLVACCSFAAGGIALVRVFDCNKSVGQGTGFLDSKIIIVYEDGRTEEVELLSFNEKNETENVKTITAALNALRAKGYKLVSCSTTGDQGALVSEYVFEKE